MTAVTPPRRYVSWSDIKPADALPALTLEVTPLTVALVPVASWDLFPGHHEPSFARRQGQRDVYLNTIALQGLTDRCVMDHVPLGALLARRKFAMKGSVHPGDVLRGEAVVTAVRVGESGRTEVDFAVTLSAQSVLVIDAEITVIRPSSAGGPERSPELGDNDGSTDE